MYRPPRGRRWTVVIPASLEARIVVERQRTGAAKAEIVRRALDAYLPPQRRKR